MIRFLLFCVVAPLLAGAAIALIEGCHPFGRGSSAGTQTPSTNPLQSPAPKELPPSPAKEASDRALGLIVWVSIGTAFLAIPLGWAFNSLKTGMALAALGALSWSLALFLASYERPIAICTGVAAVGAVIFVAMKQTRAMRTAASATEDLKQLVPDQTKLREWKDQTKALYQKAGVMAAVERVRPKSSPAPGV